MNVRISPARVLPAMLIGVLAAGGVSADDDIAAMRAELNTLKAQYEARIQALELRLNAGRAATRPGATSARCIGLSARAGHRASGQLRNVGQRL